MLCLAFVIGRPPKHDWTSARALALNGVPLRDISSRLQIPYGTLSNRAFREKWLLRRTFGNIKNSLASHDQELANTKLQHSIQTTRQAAADIIAHNGTASRLHLSGAIRKASAHLEAMPEEKLVDNHHALQSVSKAASHVHGWTQEQQQHHIQTINLAVLSADPTKLVSLSPVELTRLGDPPRQIES